MPSYRRLLGLVLLCSACAKGESDAAKAPPPAAGDTAPTDTLGSAEIKDADGKVYGTLYLAQAPGGIAVFGKLTAFPPGEWGMHLHSIGACTDSAFTAAGPHWNPTGREHGMNNPKGHHLGDIPNMIAIADSTATVKAMTMTGQFSGDSTALMDADGAAIVIHLDRDDYVTDPSGKSGWRVACGVIRKK